MNVLVPMANHSEFFPLEEFHFPKPLIYVHGRPMIEWTVANLKNIGNKQKFIFMTLSSDCERFSLDRILAQLVMPWACQIVTLDEVCQGALCTCLMAIDLIPPEEPLIICNADQYLHVNLEAIVQGFQKQAWDAAVITFPALHPRWSYARVGPGGKVLFTAEKKVISDRAIAGFYYFARGKDFIRSAIAAVEGRHAVHGLYYLSSTINEMVLQGAQVGSVHISDLNYLSFFSPQKVLEFERVALERRIQHPNGWGNSENEITVVIPMAGAGARFERAGYDRPKPLILIQGKTMIERIMENLNLANATYILLARQEHITRYPEDFRRLTRRQDVRLVPVTEMTEGTACTVLLARETIAQVNNLLIANCDQIIDIACQHLIRDCMERDLDGSILVFTDPKKDPKWSFVRLGNHGLVMEVQEKVPISELATVGIYFFRRGAEFIQAADAMIAANDRINGEFYTCPVYNYMIQSGAKIGVFCMDAEQMHGIGTPEDLEYYLASREAEP